MSYSGEDVRPGGPYVVTPKMENGNSPSDRVAGLEHLLARLQTRIDELTKLALTHPGHDDAIAGLVLVRDDLLDRQRRTGEHPS